MPHGTGLEDLVRGLVEGPHIVAHVHHGVEVRGVALDLDAEVLHHLEALLHQAGLEVRGGAPEAVELENTKLVEVLEAVHDLGEVLVVVLLLEAIGDVDGDEVGVFSIVHLEDLLLVGTLGLGLVVVGLGLLAAGFDLVADGVVLGLGLAKVGIGGFAFALELLGVLAVALAQLLETGAVVLEGLGDLGDEVASEAVVLGGAGLEGGELCGPGGEGSAARGRSAGAWLVTKMLSCTQLSYLSSDPGVMAGVSPTPRAADFLFFFS